MRAGENGCVRSRWWALGLVCTPILVGCGGGSDGSGAASFNTWGEDYIESEIPADVFADGWSITYQKFLVNIGHVKVATENAVGVLRRAVEELAASPLRPCGGRGKSLRALRASRAATSGSRVCTRARCRSRAAAGASACARRLER